MQDNHAPLVFKHLCDAPLNPSRRILPIAWDTVPENGLEPIRQQVGNGRLAQ